ncbi:hypothetical protein NL676_028173 [Syzygium grande]|nr:hypothetical protein NL676_028173 [Syzygium grande]
MVKQENLVEDEDDGEISDAMSIEEIYKEDFNKREVETREVSTRGARSLVPMRRRKESLRRVISIWDSEVVAKVDAEGRETSLTAESIAMASVRWNW